MHKVQGHRKLGIARLAVVVTIGFLLVASSAQAARQFAVTGGSMQEVIGRIFIPFPAAPQAPQIGAIVSATGTGPAQLTLPVGVFSNPTPPQGLFAPVPPSFAPYVQLTTKRAWQWPAAPAVVNAGVSSARPNANFAFCPGAVQNPNCTNPNVGGQGTRPGVITYTAGPNVFSGAISMLGQGTATLSVQTGPAPTFRHIPIGGTTPAQGFPYAQTLVAVAGGAKVTVGGIRSAGGFGMITQPGVLQSTQPGDIVTQTGFPMTTGKVQVFVPQNPPTTPNTMLTVTGSDSRTPLGAGNITLVSGGLGATTTSLFGVTTTVSMKLTNIGTVPSTDRVGVVVILTMLGGTAFFFLRRRQATA